MFENLIDFNGRYKLQNNDNPYGNDDDSDVKTGEDGENEDENIEKKSEEDEEYFEEEPEEEEEY